MRISDWSSDMCSSDLLHRVSSPYSGEPPKPSPPKCNSAFPKQPAFRHRNSYRLRHRQALQCTSQNGSEAAILPNKRTSLTTGPMTRRRGSNFEFANMGCQKNRNMNDGKHGVKGKRREGS